MKGIQLPKADPVAQPLGKIQKGLFSVSNRCYLRGTSLLGLVNTILGCLINRVLVKCIDSDTGRTVAWLWDKGTDHPPEGG